MPWTGSRTGLLRSLSSRSRLVGSNAPIDESLYAEVFGEGSVWKEYLANRESREKPKAEKEAAGRRCTPCLPIPISCFAWRNWAAERQRRTTVSPSPSQDDDDVTALPTSSSRFSKSPRKSLSSSSLRESDRDVSYSSGRRRGRGREVLLQVMPEGKVVAYEGSEGLIGERRSVCRGGKGRMGEITGRDAADVSQSSTVSKSVVAEDWRGQDDSDVEVSEVSSPVLTSPYCHEAEADDQGLTFEVVTISPPRSPGRLPPRNTPTQIADESALVVVARCPGRDGGGGENDFLIGKTLRSVRPPAESLEGVEGA